MTHATERPTRVAAIDIGTNSVLLLVAERGPDGVLRPVVERATITRLGQGVDRTKHLAPEATVRTLACLRAYASESTTLGVTATSVVGTSAMRDATGGDAFRADAAQILGTEPRVISGDEEARLTFRGGLSGLASQLTRGPLGVFDIGGGSTELIAGEGSTLSVVASLNVGSVRLTERHFKSDPPTVDELDACRADIRAALEHAPDLRGRRLIGVAGTVTTIGAIARGVVPYDGALVHGMTLTSSDVEETFARLARSPRGVRRQTPGLSPERADVIVAGAMLCAEVLRRQRASELVVSDRGVRWGLAEELAPLQPAT